MGNKYTLDTISEQVNNLNKAIDVLKGQMGVFGGLMSSAKKGVNAKDLAKLNEIETMANQAIKSAKAGDGKHVDILTRMNKKFTK